MSETTTTETATPKKPRAEKGSGHLFQRGAIWWLKVHQNGRPIYESTGTSEYPAARKILRDRLVKIDKGETITPRLDRVTYDEAAQALKDHYTVTGERDLIEAGCRLAHLARYFAGRRLASIGTRDSEAYAVKRQTQGASNGTINRELAVLGRMLKLAYEHNRLARLPVLRKLTEAPPRQGFFEPEAFAAVRHRLTPDLQVAATIMYVYGWRLREVLTLERRQLDLTAGTLSLDPGATKNGEGRVVALTADLVVLLTEQVARVKALERDAKRIVPALFPHLTGRLAGRRRDDFRRAWATACKAAGVPGMLRHDLRRTAVRNMERAAVPRSVAMKLTGHKTENVYRRYAIVSPADLRAAALKLSGDVSGDSRPAAIETRRASL
jgi:integrase